VDLDLMRRLLAAGETKAAVARRLTISRRTLYRRLTEITAVPQLECGALHTGEPVVERVAERRITSAQQHDHHDDGVAAGADDGCVIKPTEGGP
jgi:hypothetical protein